MSENPVMPICRHRFVAQELMTQFPPKLRHKNKKLVFSIACPPGSTFSGEMVFSRWNAMPLPDVLTRGTQPTTVEVREDVFGYEPGADPGRGAALCCRHGS